MDRIPLYYLLSDLQSQYTKWNASAIFNLILCCSLDVYMSYSIIIGDTATQCGFEHVKIIDDTSLIVQNVFTEPDYSFTKGNFLSIQSNDSSFLVSLVTISSLHDSSFLYDEFPQYAGSSFQQQFSLDLLSFHQFHNLSQVNHISSQSLLSFYQQYQDSFSSFLQALLSQRKLTLSHLSGIIISGSFIPQVLLSFISSLFSTIPVFSYSSSFSSIEQASLSLTSLLYPIHNKNEDDYIGELNEDGKKDGYGEEFHFGVCIYRGFWKDDMYDGLGVLMNEEGEFLYRGEFHQGKYHGQGIQYNHNEILKGEFVNGCIIDGVHISYYLNHMKCYEGSYKRGLRNGIGKEYNENGELLFEGCYLDNQRYGKGILYTKEGRLEGNLVNGEFDGEVKEYSKNHILKSVINNDYGIFYTDEGYLLYEGGVLNHQYYSHGILYYPGGHIHYDGEFLNGLFHGYGQLYTKEGDLNYIGEFKNGLKDGNGKDYSNSLFLQYVGEFKKGKRHGNGKYFMNEGHYYDGMFNEGKITGKGKMVWTSSCTYEGDFVDGKKEGHGVFTWSDNQVYDGNWKNDKRDGVGKQYNSIGVLVYEGDWKEDSPNGIGTIHYDSGSYYMGDVVHNKREGKGKQYNEQNCIEYDGEWINDQPHGYGIFYYDDHCIYEGQWVHGERDGTGRFVYANGNYFIGHFKNGYREGKGVLLNAQGKILREEVYELNKEITKEN